MRNDVPKTPERRRTKVSLRAVVALLSLLAAAPSVRAAHPTEELLPPSVTEALPDRLKGMRDGLQKERVKRATEIENTYFLERDRFINGIRFANQCADGKGELPHGLPGLCSGPSVGYDLSRISDALADRIVPEVDARQKGNKKGVEGEQEKRARQDKIIDEIERIFVSVYDDEVKRGKGSVEEERTARLRKLYEDDRYFERIESLLNRIKGLYATYGEPSGSNEIRDAFYRYILYVRLGAIMNGERKHVPFGSKDE